MCKIFRIETITIPLAEYHALVALKDLVAELQQKISSLEEEIRLLKNGRKSHTSSTPPSQDIGRSNAKSLREASLRKKGG